MFGVDIFLIACFSKSSFRITKFPKLRNSKKKSLEHTRGFSSINNQKFFFSTRIFFFFYFFAYQRCDGMNNKRACTPFIFCKFLICAYVS